MTDFDTLQGLHDDVAQIRERIEQQKAADPDHEVAIAMFQADYRRACFRLMEFQSRQACGTRTYVDGRRVA